MVLEDNLGVARMGGWSSPMENERLAAFRARDRSSVRRRGSLHVLRC